MKKVLLLITLLFFAIAGTAGATGYKFADTANSWGSLNKGAVQKLGLSGKRDKLICWNKMSWNIRERLNIGCLLDKITPDVPAVIADAVITDVPANGNGNSAPVPEPATMLLLGTGMVGIVGFRKLRK